MIARSRRPTTHTHDFVTPYVAGLASVIDTAVLANSRLSIGADPLGGANIAYWEPIAERYKLKITVVNKTVDPRFAFMPVDHDGKIRMDCSSPVCNGEPHRPQRSIRPRVWQRHGLGSPRRDRHAQRRIDEPESLSLAAAVDYLFRHRPQWKAETSVGKTLVSSSMIDRVAAGLGRRVVEVPVGFKWFVEGLLNGALGFGGEESAGASFLRLDGSVWTTDKDGIVMDLLAVEMMERTGRDPSERYRDLTERFGSPLYTRIDAPANAQQRAMLGRN